MFDGLPVQIYLDDIILITFLCLSRILAILSKLFSVDNLRTFRALNYLDSRLNDQLLNKEGHTRAVKTNLLISMIVRLKFILITSRCWEFSEVHDRGLRWLKLDWSGT